MPHISKNDISVYHKDIKKYHTINILYNREHLFYAELPPEFRIVIKHLTNVEMAALSIERKYRSKFGRGGEEGTPIISASSEKQCLTLVTTCIEKLMDKTISQRNVIIVFFNPNDTTNYNDHLYNQQHPQIGMKFGLTYAVETTAGDKKVYSLYRTIPGMWGEKADEHQERKQIDLWHKASTIIEDTPDNREMLEGIYKAMAGLIGKLKEFTASPEILQKIIDSKVKFLN